MNNKNRLHLVPNCAEGQLRVKEMLLLIEELVPFCYAFSLLASGLPQLTVYYWISYNVTSGTKLWRFFWVSTF